MKILSSRKLIITAAVLLLTLFLVRPGVSRLKARIANSISRAVARPVEIGSVHLRFLPPGFDLQNLTIYEDPAFGAEPMMRAPEVTAVIRFTALLRGRLDISRLELTEPSLNLVRIGTGRWNLEALLERSAQIPLAPTSKSKLEVRPGFPYIEATSGRINFKLGPEKKPYALLNADFALWQESENAWGVRLKAEPVRTDISSSDGGLLRMSGIWQRAGSLHETPLQFSMEWEHAQLGQLSRLVTGTDKGWRGEVRSDASLSGTPANMHVIVDTMVRDFHRYDVPSSEGMRLAAHCEGGYRSAARMMHEILCSAPVGNGMITLHGNAGLPGMHQLDLTLSAEGIPANSLERLARRAKKDLPADLASSGTVHGSFAVKENGPSRPVSFQGRGEIIDLRIVSASSKAELAVARIPFALTSGQNDAHVRSSGDSARPLKADLSAADVLRIEFDAFPVALGSAVPAQVGGWMSRSGYAIVVRGDGEVSHILRAANLLALPAIRANAEGSAHMDLRIAGPWTGRAAETANVFEIASAFSSPLVMGTVQLHNVRATIRGMQRPLEISSAELRLQPEEVRADKLNVMAANAHWTGSLSLARGCGIPGACAVRFNLNTAEAGLGEIYAWLNAPPSQRRWYEMLSATKPASPPLWASLRASGTIKASRLLIHKLTAANVSASLDLEDGKLMMSSVRADLLGGKHHGDWRADFTATPPLYSGGGTLTAISLEQVSDAMHDPWIGGTAEATYQMTAAGGDSAIFWHSLKGDLDFDLRDGMLSHISVGNDAGPLHISLWKGNGHLRDGDFEIDKGRLLSPEGAYEVSGTASLGQRLDLKLIQDAETKSENAGPLMYSITGTVTKPHVALVPMPETQAQLKP